METIPAALRSRRGLHMLVSTCACGQALDLCTHMYVDFTRAAVSALRWRARDD